MVFEWDAAKAVLNRRKHGVSFEEAATVFADPFAIRIFDSKHSHDAEQRWILVGFSNRSRVLFVVFVEIYRQVIRIISARLATTAERLDYEESRQSFGG